MEIPKYEFPVDFNTGEFIPVQLGRINIGDGVARLFFTPRGTVLMVGQSMVDSGRVVIVEDRSLSGIGLGAFKERKDEKVDEVGNRPRNPGHDHPRGPLSNGSEEEGP